MSKVKTIDVYYGEDGMFGSEGPDGYDVQASYEKFEELLTERIKKDYPDVEINLVNETKLISFEVLPRYADDEREVSYAIEYETREVYQSFEWVVPLS